MIQTPRDEAAIWAGDKRLNGRAETPRAPARR